MEDRLKPCPFCGGDNVGVFSWPSSAREVMNSVHCYDCHFGLNAEKTKEAAIEAWNTRKPMDRILEKLMKESLYSFNYYRDKFGFRAGLDVAIDIVKNGGKNE